MANPQLNIRLSPEDDEELGRWAAERGIEKGTLGKDIVREGVASWLQGRAMFDRPAALDPQDVHRLITEVGSLVVEINRVLRQNAKRDAELVRQARADTTGAGEVRVAIIDGVASRVITELHDRIEPMQSGMTELQGRLGAILDRLSAITDLAAAVDRIASDKRLDEIMALQVAHTAAQNQQTVAIRDNTAACGQLSKQPRTVNRYEIGGGDWSGRGIALVIAAAWCVSFASIFMLARFLPVTWFAEPVARRLLGE